MDKDDLPVIEGWMSDFRKETLAENEQQVEKFSAAWWIGFNRIAQDPATSNDKDE